MCCSLRTKNSSNSRNEIASPLDTFRIIRFASLFVSGLLMSSETATRLNKSMSPLPSSSQRANIALTLDRFGRFMMFSSSSYTNSVKFTLVSFVVSFLISPRIYQSNGCLSPSYTSSNNEYNSWKLRLVSFLSKKWLNALFSILVCS